MRNKTPELHPGTYLKKLLEEHKLTQTQLAEDLDWSVQKVNDIICGRRGIRAISGALLSVRFNKPIMYFSDLQFKYDHSIIKTDRVMMAKIAKIKRRFGKRV